jgi:hypothetical protein
MTSKGLSMTRAQDALGLLGLPVRDDAVADSSLRFDDGSPWRVEISSVEGPHVFDAVLDEADRRSVPVHRVSQGSGIMLQTDDELRAMVGRGEERNIEVCLFIGPRAAWDIGVQASSATGRVAATSLRGADQLGYGIEDVVHGCELGLRSILVGDLGALAALSRLRQLGHLPPDLVLKTSASLPVANPSTARVLRDLGADTLNLPVDLPLGAIAAVREAVDIPLDVYVEAPDDFGGPVRHYEVPELVRVAAPVYLKFAVRGAPGVYPAGRHVQATVEAMGRERVRRAEIALSVLARAQAAPGLPKYGAL